MTEFKALELGDRDVFLRYLWNYHFNTYEYSFLTLYLWKDYCNVEYAIIKDALIIKKTEEKEGSYFMQPIGCSEGTLPDIIEELIKIKQEDATFKCLFRDIEEPFLQKQKETYGPNIIYFEDIKKFDYIYETQKLINLNGDKLSKRKNHYHQFINQYNYSLKDLHDKTAIEDCLEFSRVWLESRKVKYNEIIFELEGIRNVLNHLDLLNAIGMAVYVNSKVAGFTIGEKVNSQMAVIHVEKGDTKYKGIYAFINKTFAESYLEDTTYINREEDLGKAGLKKAKRAYDPLKLEKKYLVDFPGDGLCKRFAVGAGAAEVGA